jgi:hypothetical protein
MKLKDFAKQVSKLAEKYPDLTVIYAIDEEGNAFHKVHFKPTLMVYKDEFREAYGMDEVDELKSGEKPNAVCVN